MKKVIKEVVVQQSKFVFVAADGKEFDNEKDCLEWEKSYGCTLEASMKDIHKITVSPVALGLPYSSDDDEVWLIKPTSLADVTLINAYIKYCTGDNANMLTASMIDDYVVLNFGCCRDWCDVIVLGDHVSKIVNHAAKVIGLFEDQGEQSK